MFNYLYLKAQKNLINNYGFVEWLVGCVLRPIDSEVIKRRHPYLLSLANDVKLGFYTFLIGNRTPGRHLAVHYTTALPSQLRGCIDR